MTDLILRHARLPHGAQADLRLSGGRIAQIAGAGTLVADGARIEDLGGQLLVPGLVEGHIHLDKTLTGVPWMPHLPGTTIAERIAAEKRLRQGLSVPVTQRAEALLARIVALGSVNVRCHVDVDDELGLAGVEALLALRERWRDRATVQLVAFPQSGILGQSRVAELLEEAARQGVEVIGGLDPAGYDGDIKGQLDIVFGIAERYGRMVDVHLHDPGELGAFQLRRIAARSAAAGLQGRVAVSHAFALGEVGRATFEATAAALRDGGVAIMTAAPGAAPMPPVAALHDAGVTVFAGSDNIRDAWSPLGNGDMLDRARLIAWRQGFAADEELWLAFATVTEHGLRALGLDGHGIREGAVADLVVLPAPHLPEAVAACPPRSLVVKAGRVVARNGALTGQP
jgi:cytosine deaminase